MLSFPIFFSHSLAAQEVQVSISFVQRCITVYTGSRDTSGTKPQDICWFEPVVQISGLASFGSNGSVSGSPTGGISGNSGVEIAGPQGEGARQMCLELQDSITAACRLEAKQTYRNSIGRNCVFLGTTSVGASGVVIEGSFSYDQYGVCKDISEADRELSLARCDSNHANLIRLCPAD